MELPLISKISPIDKLLFTKHMAVMIKSGIPIAEAVETVTDQAKNPKFKLVLKQIIGDINNGQTLEKALRRHEKVFDNLYINLIRIGEESGNLDENLEYLATKLKKDYDFQKKVSGAMLYPSIVLIATAIIGLGISLFVLPRLTDLYSSMEIELPITTKALLWFADLMRFQGVWVVLGIGLAVAGLRLLVGLKSVKPYWHRFLLTLPIVGPFIQHVVLTNFCRNMGMMLKSGIPIVSALDTQANATSNLVYKQYFLVLKNGIEKGRSLGEELDQEIYKYMPKTLTKMIGVGEKTGKLESSFTYLADFFEEEVDNASKNFSTILEPVLLLTIGLIVAFVALAIITPMYQFTGRLTR